MDPETMAGANRATDRADVSRVGRLLCHANQS
jgi:hypothetical protein